MICFLLVAIFYHETENCSFQKSVGKNFVNAKNYWLMGFDLQIFFSESTVQNEVMFEWLWNRKQLEFKDTTKHSRIHGKLLMIK